MVILKSFHGHFRFPENHLRYFKFADNTLQREENVLISFSPFRLSLFGKYGTALFKVQRGAP